MSAHLCVQEGAAGLEPPPKDKMKDIQGQTDEVIEKLKDNVKIMVDRQEKLEGLDEISKQLELEVTVTASSVNKV